MDWTAIIIAFIAAIGGGGALGVAVKSWLDRRKTGVEIDSLVSDNWRNYASALEKRICALEAKVKAVEDENATLRRELDDYKAKYTEMVKVAAEAESYRADRAMQTIDNVCGVMREVVEGQGELHAVLADGINGLQQTLTDWREMESAA